MAKTNETKDIEARIIKFAQDKNMFVCPEVTIGWYHKGMERVDFLSYDTKDVFKCYEVKVSKSDFYSKCKNTFVGNYNYYVMPLDLYNIVKQDIPKHVGVYIPNSRSIRCSPALISVKKARKQLITNKQVLKNSMIRSLYREAQKGWRKK